jgi:hypothetical protein|nr:MAG TPA: hypothetical protein [Caudoviricetes sp.]
MAKKEKSSRELYLDMLTKIKSVFNKDIYIYNRRYVIAGNESYGNIIGNIYCKLNTNYDFFSDLNINTSNNIIYIPSVVDEKKVEVGTLAVEVNNDLEIHKVNKIINQFNDIPSEFVIWRKLTDQLSDEDISLIFEENNCYNLQCDSKEITISKQILPLVTIKNIDDVTFSYKIDNENKINKILFLIMHKYFDIYALYKFIS